MISYLPVLTSPGNFNGCWGTGGSDSHNDIEVDKRIGYATQPSALIFDFLILLGSEPAFTGVLGGQRVLYGQCLDIPLVVVFGWSHHG